MKELKLRVWNIYEKKMIYDMNVIFQSYIDNEYLGKWMQWTGLQDKNVVDIYEGDIILSKYFDDRIDEYVKRKGKVIFEDGCFKLKGDSYWIPLLTNLIGNTWTIEVIGNIYENKELIKNEKRD